MIFNRTLNYIFSSFTHIAVLRVLQYSKAGLTGREISRRANITAKSALNALTNLEKLKIVKRQIGGRDHIFTINYKHYLVVKGILPLLEAENNFLKDLMNAVKKKFSRKCESIILFGSVARKEEELGSDLDLCFVVTNKRVQKKLEVEVNDEFNILAERYGVILAVLFFTTEEYKRKAKKNEQPIKDITKDGILISGKAIKALVYGKENKKNQHR